MKTGSLRMLFSRLILVFSVAAAYTIGRVVAFSTHGFTNRRSVRIRPLLSRCILTLASLSADDTSPENDEYDDFYADFDPSDYEMYNQVGQANYDQEGYTRDLDVDNSDVDEDAIIDLIGRRAGMRQRQEYDQADEVLGQLFEEFGVLVRDQDRKWRAGCSGNENHSDWLYGNSTPQQGSKKNKKDYGPNGHDYTYAKDAGPSTALIPEEEINELLATLLSYKLSRDFDGADAIQVELLSAGVLVDAKARQWRADGRPFSNFVPNEYKMYPHDYDLSRSSEEIMKLIQERAQARAERLFKRSDEIRDELLQKYEVRINDKMLLWTVGPEQSWGRPYQPYKMSNRSKVPSDVEEIERLIHNRDIARDDRDFAKADEIRSELLDKYVFVDDKDRTWCVGEVSTNSDKNRQLFMENAEYTMAQGSPNVNWETQRKIQRLVEDRGNARGKRDYKKADSIKKDLLDLHGVAIDDKKKEWSIVKRKKRSPRHRQDNRNQ